MRRVSAFNVVFEGFSAGPFGREKLTKALKGIFTGFDSFSFVVDPFMLFKRAERAKIVQSCLGSVDR